MLEEVPAFLWAEAADDAAAPMQKAGNGALGGLAQMRLEFAEGQLDRVEVWRIRWKVKQRRTRCFNCLPDASNPVSWKIVYHDDVAALEEIGRASCRERVYVLV